MPTGAVKPPTPKSTPPTTAPPGAVPPPGASDSTPLKPSLPGPPYGLGFPPPPPAANGLPAPTSEAYRSPYDAHPGIRGAGMGLPPGGKP